MKNDKVLSLLGLSLRSGNLVSGEYSTEKVVKGKKAKLVIVSSDASDNTKKLFTDKCQFYKIPLYIYGTKAELGKAVGKEIRSSVAVTDKGLAETIIKRLEDS